MDMAAIFFMWPEPFEQSFVHPSQGGSTWNFASNGSVVSEEKMYENVDSIHILNQKKKRNFTPGVLTVLLGS